MAPPKTYDFHEQLKKGEAAELDLDHHFSSRFDIEHVDMSKQKDGCDRHFTHVESGWQGFVEYKTDWRCEETGNAFIETVSQHREGRPDVTGWVHKCKADMLFYYLPHSGEILFLRPKDLRTKLPTWEKKFRHASCRNRTYSSQGVLVPLAVLRAAARRIEKIRLPR